MIRNGPLEPRDRAQRARAAGLGRILGTPTEANRRVRPPAVPSPSEAPPFDATDRIARADGAPRALPEDPTRPTRQRARTVRTLRSRWPLIKKALAALAVLGTATGGALAGHRYLTRSRYFALREIRVSPTRRVTPDALRARAGVALGENLFTIDLEAVRREVLAEPWVSRVEVRRELPGRLVLDVTERDPACVLAFGPLYLADAKGEAFKRATLDEAAGLPVVTGVARDAYVDDREAAQGLIREALAALSVWRERPGRAAVGEVHVDPEGGVTIYTARDAVGVRIGRADAQASADPTALADSLPVWRERLGRYDAVAAELARTGDTARAILVDQVARPDRVTVHLASR